tara:strand:+ start:406 stop:606 length:201 start_codon:yes stop_codon:yes gene_type:complete
MVSSKVIDLGSGMKEKPQAPSNKLRQIVAGQFVQLTKHQASSDKLRHFAPRFKPGLRVKNRSNRKR